MTHRGSGAWLVRASALVLLALAALAVAACGPDCTNWSGLESYDQTATSVTLTAAKPVAEQAVTVRLNAAALPLDTTDAATLVIRPPQRYEAPTPSPRVDAAAPPTRVVELSLLDGASGRVLSTTTASGGQYAFGSTDALLIVALDCPPGAACERAYRLRVAAPWLTAGAEASLDWEVRANVTYEGITEACGVPKGATAEVDVGTPGLVPAGEVALAGPVSVAVEPAAAMTARHVTIDSDRAPAGGASMRVAVAGLATVGTYTWVRVIPDSTGPGVAAQPVSGDVLAGLPGTVDVPILDDCPGDGPCRRGYWVVFQTFVQSNGPTIPAPDAPPADVGRLAWTASAIARAGPEPGGHAATLAIMVDGTRPGVWLAATIAAAAAPVDLRESGVPVVIDAVITVPERPDPDAGLDRLAAAVAIVHAGGEDGDQWARLEGDGAGPLVAYNSGYAVHSLVAHPLDACPASGVCTVNLQLIGWTTERRVSGAEPSTLEWSIDLVGAPPGTAIRFGEPREIRPVPWALVVATVVIATMLAILAVALRRRQARRRKALGALPGAEA